jgi:branched-chain amino acid transport system ATP-binding protein
LEGLAAVSDCSLKVKKGTITGIIGPNGSGKTTLFNLIAGNLKSSSGSVTFDQRILQMYHLMSCSLRDY